MSETRVIHSTQSPPVGEIIYWANQKSINLYAEHLLKAMGQGSTSGGLQSVQAFLDEQGINMVDGSGLSRKNFITSKQFATLLVRMKKSPHFSVFFKSLPEEIPGVFAKSGYMSHIRSLVGYKGDIAFAILINHGSDSKSMKKMIEEIIFKLK
jgi:D-alanyl-D-alanine carboxypeptidase/D-alanyl-D-alanine-endopeptidase (penicillin-binding protein 4)